MNDTNDTIFQLNKTDNDALIYPEENFTEADFGELTPCLIQLLALILGLDKYEYKTWPRISGFKNENLRFNLCMKLFRIESKSMKTKKS